jgi:cytochrome c biogenesis protein CcdA/thiol-disulfide isomerase/thioredoxin
VLGLIAVSLIAGAATVLAPCVLPVLPVVLAGGAGGGRRGPVGIALGLAVSFTVFTLTASRLERALGLPQDLLFHAAVVLIALVGLAMVWPRLGELAGRPFGPLARGAAGRLSALRADGIRGGLLLGVGLGLVWTPCAGPVLGAISTLAARERVSASLVAVTAAYALGAAVPVLLLALGGQRALERLPALRARAPRLRQALGLVLAGAALLFLTDIPTRLATASAGLAPGVGTLEGSHAVKRQLDRLVGAPRFAEPPVVRAAAPSLPVLGTPPDFDGIVAWLDTPGGRPLTIAGLRGRVVLIDFWTYSCINCLRTLPYLKAWDARYRAQGLTIVGVHSPEFAFEHVVANVRHAIAEHGIRYPVAVDSSLRTWDAWQNEYWPAEYLIDRQGRVRAAHAGEGEYAQTEQEIRALLGVSGSARPVAPAGVVGIDPHMQTPETYLGFERGAYDQAFFEDRMADYGALTTPREDHVRLGGRFRLEPQRLVAGRGASLALRFASARAYVVLAPTGHAPGTVQVRVDGGPWRTIRVGRDDLYQVAGPDGPTRYRTLVLRPQPGVAAYSFTFG